MLQAYGVGVKRLGTEDPRSGNASGDDAGYGSDSWSGWESGNDEEGVGKVTVVVNALSKVWALFVTLEDKAWSSGYLISEPA